MTPADWINVAKCANRRKDPRFGPLASLGLPASDPWHAEHGTEKAALRLACTLSRR